MRAAAKDAMRSPAAREGALVTAHVADTRLVLAHDAAITATLLQNLGPVITSLQPTKDAVLRIGALLVAKVDWVVNVFQLTAAQQALLDHRPQLAFSPHEIIATLHLTATNETGNPAHGVLKTGTIPQASRLVPHSAKAGTSASEAAQRRSRLRGLLQIAPEPLTAG
jgi:hypothetical protein